jgi:hypothetical protein
VSVFSGCIYRRKVAVGVTAISLWDNKANAEAYNNNIYPDVVKTLARVMDGTPKVQSGEVVNSTIHQATA